MRHRIFIAVELSQNLKKTLAEFQKNWPELPARWIKEHNLHITLQFLGSVSLDKLASICELMETVGERNAGFTGKLSGIVYGPSKTTPRFVLARIEPSEQLINLQKDVAEALKTLGFESEDRMYSPHITLARIRQLEFRKLDPEERPLIDEDIFLSFPISSVSVMESKLKRGGAEYTPYKRIRLQ